MRSWLVVFLGLLPAALACPALAQEAAEPRDSPVAAVSEDPPSEDEVAFDLTAGTHFPVAIGLDAQLELPARLLLRAHIGWMPPAYLDLVNAVSTGAGWYDQVTADLISAAVDHAFVLRVGFGWRPFEAEGFEFSAGYTLVVGGGGLTSAEAIEVASGQSVEPRGDAQVPMRTTLHALHARVAWRWIVEQHFVIRAAVGWVHTVHADTVIDAGLDREGGPVDLAEAYLDEVLTSYAFSPEVQLMLGYRF